MYQWKRTDPRDPESASEIISLVKLDSGRTFQCCELERDYPFIVQITSGPEPGDDFIGLFDLDGDALTNLGNHYTWELVEGDVPPEVIEQIEAGWASGTYVVERVL